jgi:hypothetical protein
MNTMTDATKHPECPARVGKVRAGVILAAVVAAPLTSAQGSAVPARGVHSTLKIARSFVIQPDFIERNDMRPEPKQTWLALWAAAGALCAATPQQPSAATSESHPPYFNFKARQFLIEGSYAIAPTEPIKVGSVRQLMFDRAVIDDAWGVERTVHAPERFKGNPLVPGQVGFGPVHDGTTVLFDSPTNRFRLWTRSWDLRRPKYAKSEYWAYFESADGRAWTAPELNLVELDGSTKNNVLRAENGVLFGGLSVVEVPPRLRARGRYAGLFLQATEKNRPGETHGQEVRIAWSDDGLRWTDQAENPVIRGRTDTFNNMVYNPERDVFMMYRRPTVNANQIRRIAYSESRDLITWTQPQTILFPDEADAASMFYTLVVVRYQGMYLGFLQDFYFYADNPSYAGVVRNGPKSHQLDCELAWSRDGINWERHPKRPTFLAAGVPGEFDAGMVGLQQAIHEDAEGVSLYYTGTPALHLNEEVKTRKGTGLGLLRLRRDGFVSLDAARDGYVLTKPLALPGGRLHLNAQTEPGGFIRVALRRGDGVNDGDWIDGWNYEQARDFNGDSTDATVAWVQGDKLVALKGRSVRLHFWLHQAKLYSFWFD